jgi:hypothetical protein
MKGIIVSTFCLLTLSLFAQGESVGPLTSNPDLYSGKIKVSKKEKTSASFDSTFIYTSDTLTLPFLDEFSRNHFQDYPDDYSAPGVTSDKKYRILDNTTLIPIPNNVFYTGQHTFKRKYDITTSTYTDSMFSPTQFKVGNFSSYPVNYTTTDFYPPYYIYDTIGTADVSDTVWISGPEYFQDSATQFFATLNDPNAYWLDKYAYHNYRFAVEPWTLGVVTFDGLNEHGYPYAIGSTITNYADYLTSKPFDLSGFDASDSIYFSFLYQTEGFGDAPEASDSLVLEFYAKDLDQWIRMWSASGEPVSDFKFAHFHIGNPDFFKKGFQFRFKNYGALSGSLDHFHLDYVKMKSTNIQDTLFADLAFVYPIGSLLKTYTSVPWDHFKNNPTGKMNDSTVVVIHSSGIVAGNSQNGTLEVSYSGSPEGNYVLNGQVLAGSAPPFNYEPRTTVTSYHDLSGGYVYDITKAGNHQSFDLLATATTPTTNVNPVSLRFNDTTTNVQYFANYYSYDDGSAEAAYGPTGSQARLAIKYNAYEADSLVGAYIHFVPSVNNVSNKLFLLTVWDDNGGVPGDVLYEDEVFFPRQPEYGSERNEFRPYYFKDTMKVAVGTTYYVGWRQFDADRLNVGLDRNLDHSENTYYSLNNGVTWIQSQISGSVMIRPIVSTSMDNELGIKELKRDETSAVLYPNPTNELVKINVQNGNYEGVEIYNVQGALIIKSKENTVSLMEQPSGMYFFRVLGVNGMYKIIKN